jgi:hypothetical protein
MILNGYVKLHRQIIEWEWYADSNVFRTFLHLLISANFEDKKWQGVMIKRGQLATSIQHISGPLGISIQSVKTALEKLEKTGEILRQSTNKFTIITVCKFDSYQGGFDTEQQTTNKPLTNEQQTTNKPLTNEQQQRKNDNKDKNTKEDKEKNIPASEISILKVERMWHQEIETYSTYINLHPELKTAVKFYLDDQEEKEKKGITTTMVQATLLKVQGHLTRFDYKKVVVSLYEAVQKSNKDFNPAWNKPESTNQNTENGKVAVDWVMGKAKIQTGKV